MKHTDEQHNITVPICLSNHIPSISFTREIGGTIYTITGSYDGQSTLPAKVMRLMQQDAKSDPQEG